jgi:hypothetical protein
MMHAVTDLALQGDHITRYKKPTNTKPWWLHMGAHGLINAGGVYLVTGSVAASICEAMVHPIIDLLKLRRTIGAVTDQIIHLMCRALYAWYCT